MTKLNNRTIFILDDDEVVCDSLRCLFETVHFKVETYKSALAFLDSYNSNIEGCILADVRMPIMNGLELLEHLNLKKNRVPVVMITGYADVSVAIRAMKLGAFDFILKPFNDQCLLETVEKCINLPLHDNANEQLHERLKLLSERERQVIDLIAEGKLNKEIAYELSISMSTVEAHRANIMRKMQARNIAQLIKMYIKSQLATSFPLSKAL